jgi:signal transduction histidine kinase
MLAGFITHGIAPGAHAAIDDIVPEILAVVREALSNVARHARAGSARVSVRAAGGWVTLSIEDDGVGIDPARARGGVVTMGERAADLGGSFEVSAGRDGGTTVLWRVPATGQRRAAGSRPRTGTE